MNRPTREQVDDALAAADVCAQARDESSLYPSEAAMLALAAELRVLRLDYAADIRVRNQHIAELVAALSTLREKNERWKQQLAEAIEPLITTARMLAERFGHEPEGAALIERVLATGRRLTRAEDEKAELRASIAELVKAARQHVEADDTDINTRTCELLEEALKPFEEP